MPNHFTGSVIETCSQPAIVSITPPTDIYTQHIIFGEPAGVKLAVAICGVMLRIVLVVGVHKNYTYAS